MSYLPSKCVCKKQSFASFRCLVRRVMNLHLRNRKMAVLSITTLMLLALTVVAPIALANSGSAVPSMSICSTGNLSGVASLQGETGYQIGILTLENIGPQPCLLPSRPSIKLIWRGATLAIRQILMTDGQSRSFGGAAIGVLKPHAKSAVGLAWHNWCKTLPPRTSPFSGTLDVFLSRLSSPLRINLKKISSARCDFPGQESTIAVGRFRLP